MSSKDKPIHNNNFGFIRLILASLVIISHSPEILDGNRSREILTQLFGTLSFGELAVDGFFIASGYLVTMSYTRTKSVYAYMMNRVLRIYPGFLVAYIISYFFVGHLAGGQFPAGLDFRGWSEVLGRALLLKMPILPHAFEGSNYATLNGSMWTIYFEFLCYLMVVALGLLSVHQNRKWLVLIVAMELALLIEHDTIVRNFCFHDFTERFIRLSAAFNTGALLLAYAEVLKKPRAWPILSLLIALVLMNFKPVAEFGLIFFGGYALLWFSLNYRSNVLNKVGTKVDLSYGIYLYAWPTQKLLIQYFPDITVALLNVMTGGIACTLAMLSWFIVERPAINLKKKFAR